VLTVKRTEEITAYGHSLVQATHETTFEITKDTHLTRKGDCIIAVKADKSLMDLSQDFRETARKPDARIKITIEAEEERETVTASGNSGLLFSHPTDIVVRKSNYVCSRTLAVKSDKAANDLSKELVKKLKNPNQKVRITLTVNTPEKCDELS
jgi:hypothetical protein